MRGFQQTIMLGNLTKDPEIRFTPQKRKVAQFTVAVNKEWKDFETKLKKSKVDYIPVTAWEHLAEIAELYLKKGQLIQVTGELRCVPFSKENKITILQLVATDIIMLSRSKNEPVPAPQNGEPQGDPSASIDQNDPLNTSYEEEIK